jgi:hypothetical protein
MTLTLMKKRVQAQQAEECFLLCPVKAPNQISLLNLAWSFTFSTYPKEQIVNHPVGLIASFLILQVSS